MCRAMSCHAAQCMLCYDSVICQLSVQLLTLVRAITVIMRSTALSRTAAYMPYNAVMSQIDLVLQPLKRLRASCAAELGNLDAMVPMPHCLQQAVTPSNLPAYSASLCTLQSLAKQGQASMAAIHQRVSQWAQKGDNTVRRHQPEQRSAIGFVTRSGYDNRATSIQAELQLRQQHALRHLSDRSSQAPSSPPVTSDTRLLWPPSVDMEQTYNSRDPRQDPDARGVKRLCSPQSMSTSPVHPRLCFAASCPSTGAFTVERESNYGMNIANSSFPCLCMH